MSIRTTQAQDDRLDQIDTSHFVANMDCLTSYLPRKGQPALVAVTDHEDRPHYLVVDQSGAFGPATRKQAYAFAA